MKEFPPFRLDVVNQCLWRSGAKAEEERILVTPKAFMVLRILVENAGRLVSQKELLNAAWHGMHVEPAVLNNQILNIRNILGDSPKKPVFVETVFHRGYRFVAPVREAVSVANLGEDSLAIRLIGRQTALAALRTSLGDALNAHRQIVFVIGEPGIGKTTLLDEFQRQAKADVAGIRIVRGQCTEGYGGREPYYPILQALSQLCQGPEGDWMVRALASVAPTWLVQFPALMKREHRALLQREILGATRERMLREMGELLEVIASTTPLLLAVDDLQWVDPSTVDLISALARRREPARLMVLNTYRTADVESYNFPLKALTRDLLVHGLSHEIALDSLTETEITECLSRDASGTPPSAALAVLLYRRSEGNPLFMVAALKHLNEQGLICRDHGGWQPKVALEEIDLEVPESLRGMIETRIERLSAEEQQVLEAASLHGSVTPRFPVKSRAGMIGMEPGTFEDLCAALSRHGIVRPAASKTFPDGTVSACYEFVHALYREVCYRRITPGRRAKLHRQYGEWVEEHWGALSEAAAWLAPHFEKASDWRRAVKYLTLAADSARRRYAYAEAIPVLQHAAKLVNRLPEKERATREAEILEKLAICSVSLWEYSTAAETYKKLVALADRQGLMDVEIRALLDMATPAAWISPQLLIETVERALRLTDRNEDSLSHAGIRAACFAWRAMAGGWRSEDAERCCNEIEHLEREGDERVLAERRLQYAQIQLRSSRYGEAHRNAVESFATLLSQDDLTRDFGDFHHLHQYRLHSALVIRSLLLWGKWGQALKEIPIASTRHEKNGDYLAKKAMPVKLAWVHLAAMDFSGVVQICKSLPASFCLRTTDRQRDILAGSAETALGNHHRGLELLTKVKDEMDRQPMIDDWYYRMPLQTGLTELWLVQGDFGQARREAECFLHVALATAEHTYQGLAWDANARVAMAVGDWKQAENCMAKALSAIEGYEVPLATWRVHGTAAELYSREGASETAKHHREFSRATIKKLANSMPQEEPLRQIFLSTPMVRKIFSDNKRPAVRAKETPSRLLVGKRGRVQERALQDGVLLKTRSAPPG